MDMFISRYKRLLGLNIIHGSNRILHLRGYLVI